MMGPSSAYFLRISAKLMHSLKMEQSLLPRRPPLLIEPLCHIFGLGFAKFPGTEHDRVVMHVPHAPTIRAGGWSNGIAILHHSYVPVFRQL